MNYSSIITYINYARAVDLDCLIPPLIFNTTVRYGTKMFSRGLIICSNRIQLSYSILTRKGSVYWFYPQLSPPNYHYWLRISNSMQKTKPIKIDTSLVLIMLYRLVLLKAAIIYARLTRKQLHLNGNNTKSIFWTFLIEFLYKKW